MILFVILIKVEASINKRWELLFLLFLGEPAQEKYYALKTVPKSKIALTESNTRHLLGEK